MAFSASGTDYRGNQYSRDRADEGLTRALDAKGRAEKQARIKKSGQRSGMQKLLSTAARGAAAYYTGGLSETMGGGDMIDSAMLGTDSEGNAVKNEYGGLIKAGSGVYQGMKANKASDIADKRALNLQKFNQKKDLAIEVGKLDKGQGIDLLVEADALRKVQENQTAAADNRGLWGWDNKFDDLDMTPSQIKGQEVAQERKATTLASEGRRQGGQLDGRKAAEDQLRSRIRGASTMEQGPSREDLYKGGREERDNALLRSRISNIQTADRGPTAEDLDRGEGEKRRLMTSLSDQGPSSFNTTQSESKMAQIKKDKMMDDMMDREYNKSLTSPEGYSSGGSARGGISYNEAGSNEAGRNALVEAQSKIPSYFEPSIGKTFSEKEAEELSRRDTDKARTGSMDDIAIDSEGNRLTEKYSGLGGGLAQKWDSVANPEQAQLYLEHQQRQKEALDREQARTGGPMAGEGRQRASSERPESRFKKRILKRQALDRISDAQLMDSLKNIGGINA